MCQIRYLHFIIVLAILKFGCANEVEIDPIRANHSQKYCFIQEQHCGDDLHPLCKTQNMSKLFESEKAKHIKFLELNEADKSNFLIEINKFRNKLAGGQIDGYKSGSNLQLVKWSLDFAELAEAYYRYNSFCKKISINNSEFLEDEEFLDENQLGAYFYKKAIIEKVTESYGIIIWKTLFRAEFNRIGCTLVNHRIDAEYKFFCYTNRNEQDGGKFSFDTAYKHGAPCTECGVSKCNKMFRNLCNGPDDINWTQYEFKLNLLDYGDYNDDVDDSHLFVYLIIGLVILLVALLIGLIFLYCCVRDHLEDAGESYEIKVKGHARVDIFSDVD